MAKSRSKFYVDAPSSRAPAQRHSMFVSHSELDAAPNLSSASSSATLPSPAGSVDRLHKRSLFSLRPFASLASLASRGRRVARRRDSSAQTEPSRGEVGVQTQAASTADVPVQTCFGECPSPEPGHRAAAPETSLPRNSASPELHPARLGCPHVAGENDSKGASILPNSFGSSTDSLGYSSSTDLTRRTAGSYPSAEHATVGSDSTVHRSPRLDPRPSASGNPPFRPPVHRPSPAEPSTRPPAPRDPLATPKLLKYSAPGCSAGFSLNASTLPGSGARTAGASPEEPPLRTPAEHLPPDPSPKEKRVSAEFRAAGRGDEQLVPGAGASKDGCGASDEKTGPREGAKNIECSASALKMDRTDSPSKLKNKSVHFDLTRGGISKPDEPSKSRNVDKEFEDLLRDLNILTDDSESKSSPSQWPKQNLFLPTLKTFDFLLSPIPETSGESPGADQRDFVHFPADGGGKELDAHSDASPIHPDDEKVAENARITPEIAAVYKLRNSRVDPIQESTSLASVGTSRRLAAAESWRPEPRDGLAPENGLDLGNGGGSENSRRQTPLPTLPAFFRPVGGASSPSESVPDPPPGVMEGDFGRNGTGSRNSSRSGFGPLFESPDDLNVEGSLYPPEEDTLRSPYPGHRRSPDVSATQMRRTILDSLLSGGRVDDFEPALRPHFNGDLVEAETRVGSRNNPATAPSERSVEGEFARWAVPGGDSPLSNYSLRNEIESPKSSVFLFPDVNFPSASDPDAPSFEISALKPQKEENSAALEVRRSHAPDDRSPAEAEVNVECDFSSCLRPSQVRKSAFLSQIREHSPRPAPQPIQSSARPKTPSKPEAALAEEESRGRCDYAHCLKPSEVRGSIFRAELSEITANRSSNIRQDVASAHSPVPPFPEKGYRRGSSSEQDRGREARHTSEIVITLQPPSTEADPPVRAAALDSVSNRPPLRSRAGPHSNGGTVLRPDAEELPFGGHVEHLPRELRARSNSTQGPSGYGATPVNSDDTGFRETPARHDSSVTPIDPVTPSFVTPTRYESPDSRASENSRADSKLDGSPTRCASTAPTASFGGAVSSGRGATFAPIPCLESAGNYESVVPGHGSSSHPPSSEAFTPASVVPPPPPPPPPGQKLPTHSNNGFGTGESSRPDPMPPPSKSPVMERTRTGGEPGSGPGQVPNGKGFRSERIGAPATDTGGQGGNDVLPELRLRDSLPDNRNGDFSSSEDAFANAVVTDAPPPPGSVLLDRRVTVEGDLVHTDRVFALPLREVIREKSTTSRFLPAPPKYEGIGPTDEGVPTGLRNSVKKENMHNWYKTMFKSLHKADSSNDAQEYVIGYSSEPESSTKGRIHRKKNSAGEHRGHAGRQGYPASAKSSLEVYDVRPRLIEDYEPGHSSVTDGVSTAGSKRFLPSRNVAKPTYEFKNGYESDTGLLRKSTQPEPPSLDEQKAWYRDVQKGGDIPPLGLGKTLPDKPPDPTVGPVPPPPLTYQVNRTYPQASRPQTLPDAYAHQNDNGFNQGGPEALVRPELQRRMSPGSNRLSPPSLNRASKSPDPKIPARALFHFEPQSPKELPLEKGERVLILRQLDKNWYEGERAGVVGIFPISYVEIVPPESVAEGLGRALFDFAAQTSVELSVRKGDCVSLVRRVDAHWFEARTPQKKGIVPVSYIQVLQEPQQNGVNSPGTSPASSPAKTNGAVPRGGPRQETLSASPRTPSPFEATDREKTSGHTPRNSRLVDPVMYRALYGYRPQNSDELELREGDSVCVVEMCDDGWFVGTSDRTGTFGIFPGNYVTRICPHPADKERL